MTRRAASDGPLQHHYYCPFKKILCFLLVLPTATVALSRSRSSNVPPLPSDPEGVIRQAAMAVQNAFCNDGVHRQTIRLPLSESMYSQKEESFVADRAIGWQGGPQETYRFLSPMAKQLLQQVDKNNNSGLTPKVQEQVLLDFDGSSLLNAVSPMGALKDSLALLQPNTDSYYSDYIQQLEEQFSDTPGKAKRLLLLVNPAWRYDSSSWGYFMQAKRAQTQILDRYPTTFALDQFIMRGYKMSLLKVWPYDWCVYCTSLSPSNKNGPAEPRLLGTYPERPEYNKMEQLLRKQQQKQQ